MLRIILTIQTVKMDKMLACIFQFMIKKMNLIINFNIKWRMYMYILHVPDTSGIRLEIFPQQMEYNFCPEYLGTPLSQLHH